MDKTKHMQRFNATCIHNRIDPYFIEDIDCYYEDPHEFSLSLKRSTDALALYGVQHVALRQAFFNDLPQKKRLAMILSKLSAQGLLDWVMARPELNGDELLDAVDVGKGRSIYKLISNHATMVIKEKPNDAQRLFNEIAKACNRPYPKSSFKTVRNTHWELSDCLDDNQRMFNHRTLGMHARAAAFGDFIELGDRHFENYMVNNDDMLAIDVAHLMEPDNHHWTKSYIAGGLYECCILQHFIADMNHFSGALTVFFDSYEEETRRLFDAKQHQPNDCLAKIREKWGGVDGFLEPMISLYCDALRVMFQRLPYKHLLNQLVQSGLNLNDYQELKMYHLADEQRMSTFFRAEELSGDIFETIRELAFKRLGITTQFFTDHEKMHDQLNAMLGQLPKQRRSLKCH